MPQLQLAAGIGPGDVFALLVVAFVWAIAISLERTRPAAPSSEDGWVASLAWEDPAAPEHAQVGPRDSPMPAVSDPLAIPGVPAMSGVPATIAVLTAPGAPVAQALPTGRPSGDAPADSAAIPPPSAAGDLAA